MLGHECSLLKYYIGMNGKMFHLSLFGFEISKSSGLILMFYKVFFQISPGSKCVDTQLWWHVQHQIKSCAISHSMPDDIHVISCNLPLVTCHVTRPVGWHVMSCHSLSPVTLPCPPAWFWPTVGVWGWVCYICQAPSAQAWGAPGSLQRWNIGKGQPVAQGGIGRGVVGDV